MSVSWWFLWILFLVVFLVPSIGYGWGYRKWGPPYPRYIQRRRAQQTVAAVGGSGAYNHESWGWIGDFVWMVLLVGLFWAFSAIWWW